MEDNRQNKNTVAKIKANNKYSKSHYKRIGIDIKPSEADFIDNLAKSLNISKASLIVKSLHYIYNNNVDIANYSYSDTDKTE